MPFSDLPEDLKREVFNLVRSTTNRSNACLVSRVRTFLERIPAHQAYSSMLTAPPGMELPDEASNVEKLYIPSRKRLRKAF